MKCDKCGEKITELIMGKIKGTYLKKEGKLFKICSDCQKNYTVEELKKGVK